MSHQKESTGWFSYVNKDKNLTVSWGKITMIFFHLFYSSLSDKVTLMKMDSRFVEILLFACFICGVIIGTFIQVFNHRENKLSPDQWCGPSFKHFSVEITNHSAPQNGGYNWTEGGMFFPAGTYWRNTSGDIFGCPCLVKNCVSICGEKLNKSTEHAEKSKSSLAHVGHEFYLVYLDPSYEIENNLACGGILEEYKPVLLEDGRVFSRRVVQTYLNQKEYCLDYHTEPMTFNEFIPHRFDEKTAKTCAAKLNMSSNLAECEKAPTELERHDCKMNLYDVPAFKKCCDGSDWLAKVKSYAMLLSVPFLLLSFTVLLLTPSLLNLHGKALLCYMFCLTLSYTLFPLTHFISPANTFCIIIGAVVNFSMLGSFFWLNVMSLDIWLTFSNLSTAPNSRSVAAKLIERRKFLVYSVYAWGGAAALIAITLFMDLSPLVPENYIKPQFGVDGCWHHGNDAKVLYFFLPSGLLLGWNFIMFTTTAFRLWRHAVKSKGLSSESGQQRFSLYSKLFLVMGVNWVLEVVSFVLEGNDFFWIASDLANSLLGVVIFLLFFCKRKIVEQLSVRFRPQTSRTRYNLNSHTTRMSNLSSRPYSSAAKFNVNNMPASSF